MGNRQSQGQDPGAQDLEYPHLKHGISWRDASRWRRNPTDWAWLHARNNMPHFNNLFHFNLHITVSLVVRTVYHSRRLVNICWHWNILSIPRLSLSNTSHRLGDANLETALSASDFQPPEAQWDMHLWPNLVQGSGYRGEKLCCLGLSWRKAARANNMSSGILFRETASCFSGTQS